MNINILAIGDVVGPPGIAFLKKKLPGLKKLKDIGFTVINGENAAGLGITPDQADDILSAGADVITLGNHSFGKPAIIPYLDDSRYILRPANLAPQNPGRGWGFFDSPAGEICVANLIGRCHMPFGPDNPFFEMDRILKSARRTITLVDFHAEATSEKLAMAHYLDGRVSALWGTHTHVQTSDGTVFPGGTGYITDLGMTGSVHSVIGILPEQSISMFLNNPPKRFELPGAPCKIECAIFEVDAETGKTVSVEALRIVED